MTPEPTTLEDNRSSSEIEADIRKTRGRMDSTLDALGDRLSARSLLNSALDWWESPGEGNQGSAAVRNAAGTLATQARRHPMPAVLIGAGVAWLISESGDDDREPARLSADSGRNRYPSNVDNGSGASAGDWVGDKVGDVKDAAASAIDSVRDKSHRIGDKIHEATGRLEERTHGAMDRGKSAVREVGHEMKEGYRAVEKKFAGACEDYPLAVGVAFAALGALAGLVIPRTRREDEWMGEQSDQLIEETKEKAGELLETGKEVGSKVLETVKEEGREQGFTAGTVGDTLSDLAERGGKVLQKAKEEAEHVVAESGIKSTASDEKSTPTSNAVKSDF